MSLHHKIVLLFIGVAVLPLLIFAGVARQQSLAAADLSAGLNLLTRASGGLEVVELEAASAEATLLALARAGSGNLTEERLDALLATGVGPPPDGFRSLAVLDSLGSPIRSAELPDRTAGCRGERFSAPVRLEVPLEGARGRLAAEYWPGRGIDVRGLEGSWLRDPQGRLVMASPCAASGEAPSSTLGGSRLRGSQAVELDGLGAGTLAFARGETAPWTFAATGINVFRGPLGRLFRNYWVFVLGLGATAVLAFSLLLRRVTGSMAELTLAAERVAAGDLRPWLPTPRDDEVGHLTSAFARMTDRLRELVDQVDRTGRLAILGQLSAYLAHEIRNPLSAVKMNLQRLQRWHRAGEIPERCGGAIQVSLREVDRLSAAVSNILQLTPGEPREKEIVRVHDLVSDAARLLDSEFTKRGVGLRWELNARADRVLGDPGQLKGVIINLMLNALEAQPDGGRLLILSELHPRPDQGSGPFVELHFIDSGPGIPSAIAGQIFDPFFSTKEQGSGIGLAVARQTIRDHGGDIRLAENRILDEGAEVVVLLPLAAVSPEDRKEKTEPRVPVWGEGRGVPG
jgi:signal transduction histidine kinase